MPGLKQSSPLSTYLSQPQNQSSNPRFNTYLSQPQNQSSNPRFSTYLSQPQNQSSNANIPRNDPSDPVQILEKSIKFQNILQEIKQMNKTEIIFLLSAINNLPN